MKTVNVIRKVIGILLALLGAAVIFFNINEYRESLKKPLTLADTLKDGLHMRFETDNLDIAGIEVKESEKDDDKELFIQEPSDKDTYYYFTTINDRYLIIRATGIEAQKLYPYYEEYIDKGKLSKPVVLEGPIHYRENFPDNLYTKYLKETLDLESVDLKRDDTSNMLVQDSEGKVIGSSMMLNFAGALLILAGFMIGFLKKKHFTGRKVQTENLGHSENLSS